MLALLATVTASTVAGYVVGRLRPGRRLDLWVANQVGRELRTVGWWVAQPILMAQIAYMLVLHPRRSSAHLRSWRPQPPEPAPARDPNWAANRGADTTK